MVLASGAAGVSQIIAGSNITISPVSGTGIVTINASGGGGETAAAIPAPVLKWDQIGSGVPVPPLYVTYLPCLTSSWLSENTELWVFVYRRPKKKKWTGWINQHYASGFVHPADTSKWSLNAGKPFYAGNPGKVLHTEFPFLNPDGSLPAPYQMVNIGLSGFNPLEHYINLSTGVIPDPAARVIPPVIPFILVTIRLVIFSHALPFHRHVISP